MTCASLSITTINYNAKLISKIKAPFEELKNRVWFPYRWFLEDRPRRIGKNGSNRKAGLKFYHGYYAGGGKLRLDSLNLFQATTKINGYKFDYAAGSIPAIGSKAKDQWGFNRGGNPASLFPRILYGEQYLGDVDRSAILGAAQTGTLNKITYPTGGYSQFEYELNEYGRTGSGTLVAVPVTTPAGVSLIRRNMVSGAGTSTTTFTITSPTLVHFITRRDNCDGNPPGGSNCSIEPCQTDMRLNGPNNNNVSLNGSTPVGVTSDFDKTLLRRNLYHNHYHL